MELTRGDYDIKKFVREDANGAIIKEKPEKMYFTVKENEYSDEVKIQKKLDDGITLDDDGVYSIEFEASDTDNLFFGDYVYDIEIKNGNKPKTIQKGILTITSEITTAKDEG